MCGQVRWIDPFDDARLPLLFETNGVGGEPQMILADKDVVDLGADRMPGERVLRHTICRQG